MLTNGTNSPPLGDGEPSLLLSADVQTMDNQSEVGNLKIHGDAPKEDEGSKSPTMTLNRIKVGEAQRAVAEYASDPNFHDSIMQESSILMPTKNPQHVKSINNNINLKKL